MEASSAEEAATRGAEGAQRRAVNEAMDRYAAGDDAAFGVLYDDIAPRLFRFAMRSTRAREVAEDVVQQTLLQIHCARDRFRQGADVVPWAFAIARRIQTDLHRKAQVRRARSSDEEVDESEAPSALAPDANLHGKQLARAISAALDEMGETNRDAFLLVREEGLSVSEAAEVLGITAGALKVRVHRASETLRAVVERHERGPHDAR